MDLDSENSLHFKGKFFFARFKGHKQNSKDLASGFILFCLFWSYFDLLETSPGILTTSENAIYDDWPSSISLTLGGSTFGDCIYGPHHQIPS